MPSAVISQQMPVEAAVVFALLHDYSRRLEWDTLLREARLTRGHKHSCKGATSLCVGKPFFGLLGLETRYITFNEPNIAAVTLINRPPFFAKFNASIRHVNNNDGSVLTYHFQFSASPRMLRWLLEPIMLRLLKAETAKRLRALADFLGGSLEKTSASV
jgi:hypothetical protein